MKSIKFSHEYIKMPDEVKESMLIEVLNVELSELSKEFLNYDTEATDGSTYKLPESGAYLLLLLYDQTNCELWTTLRRYTPEKEKYYRGEIGNLFKIEIKEG